MGLFGALSGLLRMNADDWKKGNQEARDEIDKTAKKSKGFFKDLKSTWGKSSFLGQSLKLMAGGGAIAGLSMAAKELEQFTGKIADMADAMRKGDVDFAESIGDIAREAPVLGPLTKTFDNLRMAITGERAEMQKDAEVVKQSEAAWTRHKAIMEQGKTIALEWTKILADLRREKALALAAPGTEDKVKADQSFEDKIAGLRETFDKDSENVKALNDAKSAQALVDQSDKEIARLRQLAADLDARAQRETKEGASNHDTIAGADAARTQMQAAMTLRSQQKSDLIELNKITAAKEGDFAEARRIAFATEAQKQNNIAVAATEKRLEANRAMESEAADQLLADRARWAEEDKAIADKARAKKMQGMEDERDRLQEQMQKKNEESISRVADVTALRGAPGIVLLPPSNDPILRVQQEAVAQLKMVNENIKLAKRETESSDSAVALAW